MDDLVVADQLRLMFEKGPFPYLASSANAALYATVVWTLIPQWQTISWVGLICMIAAVRFLLRRAYFRRHRWTGETRRWQRVAVVGAFINGVAWGSATFLVFPQSNLSVQMLLTLLVAGMAAGAAVLSGSLLSAWFAYVVPATVPLFTRLLLQPDWLHRLMGILVFFFVVTMAVTAWAGNKSFKEAAQLRFRLARRADELEQFAGRVAHDILGPLSSSKMAISLAFDRSNESAVRNLLERAQRSSARVATIVDGLLRFARAGARPEAGEFTVVRPTVEAIMAELEPLAVQSRVKLVLAPLPDDVAVVGNPGVLTSAVENLVRNAIKYMGDRLERTVQVRVIDSDGTRYGNVRFEVTDSGPGIAPTKLDRVFDPHVRGDETGQPGIGLGLATVKRLSEAHGGCAGVQSTVGVGSTFWFELPPAHYRAGGTAPPRSTPLPGRQLAEVGETRTMH